MVSRSENVLGPYETRTEPVLRATGKSTTYNHPTVVKDLDDAGDVLVVGDDKNILLATLKWGDDSWPDVVHFFTPC